MSEKHRDFDKITVQSDIFMSRNSGKNENGNCSLHIPDKIRNAMVTFINFS